jgi:Family of unknown function (DUF6510)
MTHANSDFALDANAAAGVLQEIFLVDVTTARIECATCGASAAVGSLRVYALPMGAVLRCTHCDGILMRAVHTPHGRWLDMAGARWLRFVEPTDGAAAD